MAILRSHGIIYVDDVPVHEPTGDQAKFAWNEETTTFYYWDGAEWLTMVIPYTANALVYSAVISQADTDDPTAAIAFNNLGEVPTLNRLDIGQYELNTVAGLFTSEKTIVHATISSGTAVIINAGRSDADTVFFNTYDDAGGAEELIGDLNLTITIYP